MANSLVKRVIGTTLILGTLSLPYEVEANWLTGRTTSKTEKEKNNKITWRNKSKGYTQEQKEKLANKSLDYLPHSKIIKPAIKLGRWANNRKIKNTGSSALTSGTTNSSYDKNKGTTYNSKRRYEYKK